MNNLSHHGGFIRVLGWESVPHTRQSSLSQLAEALADAATCSVRVLPPRYV